MADPADSPNVAKSTALTASEIWQERLDYENHIYNLMNRNAEDERTEVCQTEDEMNALAMAIVGLSGNANPPMLQAVAEYLQLKKHCYDWMCWHRLSIDIRDVAKEPRVFQHLYACLVHPKSEILTASTRASDDDVTSRIKYGEFRMFQGRCSTGTVRFHGTPHLEAKFSADDWVVVVPRE
tara:strand:+ start:239 stop:781 length:543 start_codon:yes stop_codon:yes gene_type:complete